MDHRGKTSALSATGRVTGLMSAEPDTQEDPEAVATVEDIRDPAQGIDATEAEADLSGVNQDIHQERKAVIVVEILDISRETVQSSEVAMVAPPEGETSQNPAQFRETDPEEMIEEKREGTRVGTRVGTKEDNQDLLLQEAETETTEREGLTAAPQEPNRDENQETQLRYVC